MVDMPAALLDLLALGVIVHGELVEDHRELAEDRDRVISAGRFVLAKVKGRRLHKFFPDDLETLFFSKLSVNPKKRTLEASRQASLRR